VATSYVVYIDESGCEGFRFGDGSSSWFVLSAVVTRTHLDLETVKLVDDVRAILGKEPKKPLHFRDLKHHHRRPFAQAIAAARLRTVSVMVHKPSIAEPEKFQDGSRLYFYAVKFLLERVSWLCRDHLGSQDPGNGTARVVFSNRATMSYDDMRAYLSRLESDPDTFDVAIDWTVIRPEKIESLTAGKLMGLQIADAVAYSHFVAVEPDAFGNIETSYADTLRPVLYRRDQAILGYGVKIWPPPRPEILGASAFLSNL